MDNTTQVNTGGGGLTIVGGVVGGSHNHAEAVAGDVNTAGAMGETASKSNLLALLAEIRTAMASASDLPSQSKADLEEDLAAAQSAVDRPEPNLSRAAERLGSMQKVLDAAGPVVTSVIGLGKLVASAVQLVGRVAL